MQPFELITLHVRGMTLPTLVSGPDDGEPVLCLHGFPDVHRTFRHQLPALGAAGYRVFAPTLPGYHPEGQHTTGRYHLATLVDDVVAMIDAVGAERIHLVGHDWGAILGYGVAAQAPERLLSLTAMAVPLPRGMVKARSRGWVQLRRSWYIAFFVALGRFADAHVEANDWAFIERLWRTWSPAYVCPSGEMRLIKDTLGAPGVKAAALGYYRDAFELMGPRTQRAYTLFSARLQVPTLALNGSQDGCVDPLFFTLSMEQEDTLAELKLKTIPGAGHFLHLEAPKVVNRILGAWLEQHHAR